nr:hypothetical protein Iba_chr08bCG10840 [Ipomoea batatas]
MLIANGEFPDSSPTLSNRVSESSVNHFAAFNKTDLSSGISFFLHLLLHTVHNPIIGIRAPEREPCRRRFRHRRSRSLETAKPLVSFSIIAVDRYSAESNNARNLPSRWTVTSALPRISETGTTGLVPRIRRGKYAAQSLSPSIPSPEAVPGADPMESTATAPLIFNRFGGSRSMDSWCRFALRSITSAILIQSLEPNAHSVLVYNFQREQIRIDFGQSVRESSVVNKVATVAEVEFFYFMRIIKFKVQAKSEDEILNVKPQWKRLIPCLLIFPAKEYSCD